MASDAILIAEITTLRAQLKEALEKLSENLCGYCERKMNTQDIPDDHRHCVTPCDSIRIQEENHNAYLTVCEERDTLKSKLSASEAEVEKLKERNRWLVENTTSDMVRDEIRKREEAERAIETLRATLKVRGDRAYCCGLDTLSRTEALGWEAKVKTGQFGKPELDAHCLAAHWDGKHRAYYDALSLFPPAKKSQEGA